MAAASTLRSETEAETGGVVVLPIDAIYEILIRLPAEDLCRLRVVCRPWRSLLSDPQFIAAHGTRHRRLLFVAEHGKLYHDDGILCCIIDLSGRVIKKIRSEKDEWLMSTQGNVVCIAKGMGERCQLLNLDTGDRFSLPEGLSQEHAPCKPYFSSDKLDVWSYRASVALGQVASTGELKLLRVIDNFFYQLCEVFTLSGSSMDARWRGKQAAQGRVDARPLSSRVALDGVVYFLVDEKHMINQPKIASFDLLTEEWMPILRGPVSIPAYYSNSNLSSHLSLAALNRSLVLVHCSRPCVTAIMDLWFLMDFEKGSWVKQTVEMNLGDLIDRSTDPLVILENGMIVIYSRSSGLLTIYNPRTKAYTVVAEMGFACVGIGLYTGNLLSLTNDAI